jgi:hypothetical protein
LIKEGTVFIPIKGVQPQAMREGGDIAPLFTVLSSTQDEPKVSKMRGTL